MLNYSVLTQQLYEDFLVNLISSIEGFRSQVYQPTPGDNTTIGNGYTFLRNNNLAVWQAAGIALTPDEVSLLQSIDAAATNAEKNSLALQFTRQISTSDALNLTRQIYDQYEGPADALWMPPSLERAAFVAITYNRGVAAVNSRMNAFFTAIRNQDRAEAWFELRYNSWGTNATAEPGLRSVRLVESQIFGLYDNPSIVSAEESKQIYAMFQAHRTRIYTDESLWGVNPDGTVGTRNLIEEVNADTRWAAYPRVETVTQALTPARDAFIAWSNTLLPAGVSALNPADWNPAAIYFGGPPPGFIGPPGEEKGDRLLLRGGAGPPAWTERGLQAQGAGDPRLPGRGPEGLLPIDAGAESHELMIKEGLINPVPPLAWRVDGQGISQVRELEAGPGPVHGMIDQPGTDGIPEHVAEDCEKMAVLLNGETLEATLPHMAVTAIMAMIPSHMTGHPPVHQGA